MASDVIQADYEKLAELAARFQQQAELVQKMTQRVNRDMDALAGGGWRGEGIDAFAHEMEGRVLPAVGRLEQALIEAKQVVVSSADTLRIAEEEAARLFQGDAHGGRMTGSSASPQDSGGAAESNEQVTSGIPGKQPGMWSNFDLKGDGDIWQFDQNRDSARPSGFDAGLNLKYGVDGAIFGDPSEDGFSAIGGDVGVQFGMGRDGFSVGPYGEYYTVQGKLDGVLVGDSDLGLTAGIEGKVLAADGFIGIRDNSFGASIGGSLASVEGEVGTNVAGVNVGIKGEIGLKVEFGFKIGQETEVKLPFVTFGFKFGKAID